MKSNKQSHKITNEEFLDAYRENNYNCQLRMAQTFCPNFSHRFYYFNNFVGDRQLFFEKIYDLFDSCIVVVLNLFIYKRVMTLSSNRNSEGI